MGVGRGALGGVRVDGAEIDGVSVTGRQRSSSSCPSVPMAEMLGGGAGMGKEK